MDIGVDIVDISAILKIKNSQLKGVGFTCNTVWCRMGHVQSENKKNHALTG